MLTELAWVSGGLLLGGVALLSVWGIVSELATRSGAQFGYCAVCARKGADGSPPGPDDWDKRRYRKLLMVTSSSNAPEV